MNDVLQELNNVIKSKKDQPTDKSYTASLLKSGLNTCAEKFGEEAIELIVAAVNKDTENFNNEAADVLFHLLVLIESKESSIDTILDILKGRMGTSGHLEKENRTP